MSLFFKIVISVAACVVLGGLSGYLTTGEIQGWYSTINKPSWNPPNYIFGPVWTTLYVLMGIAFAMIWHSDHDFKEKAMWLFAVQFVLNLLWSFIFFNLHSIGGALLEIVLLWIVLALTVISFYRIHKTAGLLLIPYLLWVSFATVLTATIFALN